MGIARAFASEHPDVLASHAEWKQKLEDFNRELTELEARFGTPPLYTPMSGTFPAQVVGLKSIDGAEPPTGWREDAKLGCWVPNKRSKLGKELIEQLAAMKCPSVLSAVWKFISVEVVNYQTSRWLLAGVKRIVVK